MSSIVFLGLRRFETTEWRAFCDGCRALHAPLAPPTRLRPGRISSLTRARPVTSLVCADTCCGWRTRRRRQPQHVSAQTKLATGRATGRACVEEEILPGLSLVGGASGACEALQPSQNALHSAVFKATNAASMSFHFVVKNKNPKWLLSIFSRK